MNFNFGGLHLTWLEIEAIGSGRPVNMTNHREAAEWKEMGKSLENSMIASVDGYTRGWLVAMSEAWPCPRSPLLQCCSTFEEVVELTKHCAVVAVDMPIGLPDQGRRDCDALAREKLGGHAQARVFLAPPRSTLHAADWESFKRLHRSAKGAGLSRQVYGLRIKLLDVDNVISAAQQTRIFEFHPELAWFSLTGAVLPSKHTATGILTRLRLLRSHVPGLDDLATEAVSQVAIDDLLDAIVGLPVAASIALRTYPPRRFPMSKPLVDAKGLRMEIWS